MAMRNVTKKIPAGLSFIALSVFSVLHYSWAESYFNPNFLSSDVAKVADLSRFEKGEQQPGRYNVDIYLNDEQLTTGDLQFANAPAGYPSGPKAGNLYPCLTRDWFKRLPLKEATRKKLKGMKAEGCLRLDKVLPDSTLNYDFGGHRLDITIPQADIDSVANGYIPPEDWDEGIPAILANYHLSGTSGAGERSWYLNLTSGLNAGAWRLRNEGTWEYSSGHGYHRNKWRSANTYLQRTVSPIRGELVAGDSSTGGDIFDSLGFRGIRLYSSESMYPNSQQGYAPTVRGIARSRAKVTVRQNGYVVYQRSVPPGPFTITDLASTSSSGDLDVLVEELDGSQQHYIVPYSTVPLLQREGRFKYDVVAGRYRSGNSQQTKPFFMQGTLIAGMFKGLTAYGGTQISAHYRAFNIGLGKNIGDFGALSLDITQANARLTDNTRHSGQSVRFLYAKSLSQYGTNFELLGYRYSTKNFYTFEEASYSTMEGYEFEEWSDDKGRTHRKPIAIGYHNLRFNKKQRLQVNVSQQLGEFGVLFVSANRQTYWRTAGKNVTWQAGYNNNWKGVNYGLSVSWTKALGLSSTDRVIAFNMSVPFSLFLGRGSHRDGALNRMYATTYANHSSDGTTTWQEGVNGTLLEDRRLNYSVTQGHSNHNGYSGNAQASLQGKYADVDVGYSYDRDVQQYNYQLSGGIIGHANGVTFGQSLGDANVLIKAPGASGVKIENQTGVETDWRGYAIQPYATLYRENRVALDPMTMGADTEIKTNARNVVPTKGAIVLASFQTQIGQRALLTLQTASGVVPFGAMATEETSETSGLVGEQGQVYMGGLPPQGKLKVQWGSAAGASCVANYRLPEYSKKTPVVRATLRCEP